MIKVHTVILTDGNKEWSYLVSGTKTNAKGNPVPFSKTDARHMAIQRLWEEEFEPYVNKRIGETSVQQLALLSPAYRWATMEQSIYVKSHKVKSIREGDVATSTKRNADGTKRRRRNAPKTNAPAPAPAPDKLMDAAIDAVASGSISMNELESFISAHAA